MQIQRSASSRVVNSMACSGLVAHHQFAASIMVGNARETITNVLVWLMARPIRMLIVEDRGNAVKERPALRWRLNVSNVHHERTVAAR